MARVVRLRPRQRTRNLLLLSFFALWLAVALAFWAGYYLNTTADIGPPPTPVPTRALA